MSEKLTKLVVSTVLNHGVKGSEVRDWHFNVREVDGEYIVDLSTTVAISPKERLTKEERMGKYLIISFVLAFLAMLALESVGLLLPNAVLGRELIVIGTAPGFVAQLIGGMFLIRSYYGKRATYHVPEGTGIKSAEVEVPTPGAG